MYTSNCIHINIVFFNYCQFNNVIYTEYIKKIILKETKSEYILSKFYIYI